MKKIILLMAFVAVASVDANPPPLINHQGRLVDEVGNPVNDTVSVVARLFTQESGGSEAWEQSFSDVPVVSGLYSLSLGNSNLAAVLTNEAVWLELTVDGDTFTPRRLLSSVPYALHAAVAEQLEVPLAGLPVGGIAIWSGTLEDIPEGWALCDGVNGTPDLRERFVMGAPASVDPGGTGGANSYTLAVGQLPAHTHTATAESTGAHTHGGSTASAGSHSHSASTGSGGSHTHTATASNSLGSETGYTGGGGGGSRTSQSEEGYNSVSHNHNISTLASAGAHTHTVTVNSAGDHTHTITVNDTGSGQAIDNRPAFYALAFIVKL